MHNRLHLVALTSMVVAGCMDGSSSNESRDTKDPGPTIIESTTCRKTARGDCSPDAGALCSTAIRGGAWINRAFISQTGAFTAEFDATPTVAPLDAVVGISRGSQTSYAGLAAIVRFNPAGAIDARNGAVYQASTTILYTANAKYHFRLVADLSAHTYSAYVRTGGGDEQQVASGFAFRTQQALVSSLDNTSIFVDAFSPSGSLKVCSFALTASSTGTGGPPTISMLEPLAGATVSGVIALTATVDGAGVTGVQFLVDGANTGAEVVSAPFGISFDTAALPNGLHSFSARMHDATGATATASAVTVTVSNSSMVSTGHPRIFLDPATLTTLQGRAVGQAATWVTLRAACNSYLGGAVEYPDGNDYPNLPNLGSGYQGDGYVDAVLNVGLCYQIGVAIGDANTALWGEKGADLLEKMSNPSHAPPYGTDDGYGIRNYGVGMSIGYDWLHAVLAPSLLSQIYSQLNGWIAYFDASGFGHDHPCGNYFAGYYAAKAYAGLATEGDNPNAPALWNDFLNRLHKGGANAVGSHAGVQSYFDAHMRGGGWPEGWEYGPGALVHMALPALAAHTAKGIDLILDPSHPFSYPLDNGAHLMQFAWPSLTSMDDRDTLHAGNDPQSFPAAPNTNAFTVVAGMLSRYSHPLAAQYHAYARAIRQRNGGGSPWIDFLFWDDAAPEQPYGTVPLSFEASGSGSVAMRSDWTESAVWGSIRASAYVDYDGSGEQYFDAGSLAIVKGGSPFLLNATGFLVTSYPGTSISYESDIYDEIWGSGARRLFNTFYNGPRGQITAPADASPAPRTRVSRYEDGAGYVLTQAEGLADVYASDGVSSWSRMVVYFRPGTFVVFDRTLVPDLAGDQHLNWHLALTPSRVGAPSPGAIRYDVSNGVAGFVGAVTTLLPADADASLVNVFSSNKVYRLEVRPPVAQASAEWLTVFDAAPSAAQVAVASTLTASNARGALLEGAIDRVALFADSPTDAVRFSVPARTTQLLIGNLSINAGYSVSATPSVGHLDVTVQPSGGFSTTPQGNLYVSLSASGAVTSAN